MKENHYLIVDNNLQYFSYIVKAVKDKLFNGIESWKVIEAYEIPLEFNCPFSSKIFKSEVDFINNCFCGKQVSHQSFCGWELCCHDFATLKRLLELFPAYSEFQKLGNFK